LKNNDLDYSNVYRHQATNPEFRNVSFALKSMLALLAADERRVTFRQWQMKIE
jgi:hypothetical protein